MEKTPDAQSKPAENGPSIKDLVEKKTSAVAEEVASVKKEIDSFRTDIDQMKSELKQVTSTFESSLVELKAFQAEMINPINFMRKYIETLEIRNLSDPLNTVRPLENPRAIDSAMQRATLPSPPAPRADDTARPSDIAPDLGKSAASTEDNPVHDPQIPAGRQPRQALPDFKPKMAKKPIPLSADPQSIMADSMRYLTPGKIMSIVSLIDEMLATMGPDGIELVIEQYRALGMKPEEERLIYGVLRMLNESKLQTDDIIAIFYRFGQVMGINDEEAELQYMKLIANRRVDTNTSAANLGKTRTHTTGGD